MKIDLQFPFSKDYKVGYLSTNKEPRRVISLVRFDNTKTSTSYARYLMCCHLERYLSLAEHVDHFDENKLNDDIGNLQILSQKENSIKHVFETGKNSIAIKLVCPICNNIFFRYPNNVRHKLKNGHVPTCSRKCGGIKSHLK